MFENSELTNALQAMAESMNSEMFDSIIEGAAIIIEDTGMNMDEAIQVSAAALFNEDMIDESAYSVTDAVINEYANNRQLGWDEALTVISESVDAETFDTLMTEAVNDMIAKVKAKGEAAKAAAAEKVGDVKDAAKEGAEYAKAAGQVAAKAVKKEVKDAQKAAKSVKGAISRQVLKNKVEDKVEGAKEAAAEKVDAAKDAVKAVGDKVVDAAKAAKEKIAPKNESAMTLRDLRAIMESATKE